MQTCRQFELWAKYKSHYRHRSWIYPVGNGFCKMTSILCRPQLVNDYITCIEYNRHGPDNMYLSNNKTNNESRGLIRRPKRGQWTVPAKPSHVMWEGVFHKNIFITIQIWWKFNFAFIRILNDKSLEMFAHDTTAVLSCHVQTFLARMELQRNEFATQL